MLTDPNIGGGREEERKGEREREGERRREKEGGRRLEIAGVSPLHTPKKSLAPDLASTFTQATSYLRSRIIIIYPSLPKVLIKDGQTLQSIKVQTHT